MEEFITAKDEQLMNDRKFLARATYNSGVVAAKGFAGKLPRFEDLYRFPKAKAIKKKPQQIQAELMAWAIQTQSATRKDKH